MRLTYVGHASVLIEAGGRRILTDPWLVGPSQFHAWWHVPPLTIPISQLGPVDAIIISHIHDDHFHLPTLERLPKTATVLIPYAVDHWMGQVLREMGFARVLELEHGRPYRLEADVLVRNFQCGRIDSAYWLQHDGQVILNLNDCPASKPWLTECLRGLGALDVVASAFSYASPYPLCYDIEGMDHDTLLAASTQRVLDNFAETMAFLRPRYVVPFATQYGFLLPEQLWMTAHIPTPLQALAALAARDRSLRGVLLNPGDELSVQDGMRRTTGSFDWHQRDRAVAELSRARAPEIVQTLAEEAESPADLFERFRAYFRRVLSRNRLLRRRIRVPVAFVLTDRGERWALDCTQPLDCVATKETRPSPIEIHMSSKVLYAALDGRVHWETLYLSNRLQVRLPERLLGNEWEFWRMLFNFPHGIFRDRLRWCQPRGLRILWRRRREMARMLVDRLTMPSQREPVRDDGAG